MIEEQDEQSSGSSYNDSSELEPTIGPDYKGIDRAVFGTEERETEYENLTPEQWLIAWKGVSNVVKWVYQRDSRNFQGIGIRALIVCWIWLPVLHALTLTQLAGRFGMAKQSFGRWVVDWKRCFPSVVTAHMRSEIKLIEQDGFDKEEEE